MARGMAPEAVSADDDKKRIQNEKKQLKKQQKDGRPVLLTAVITARHYILIHATLQR